ncbi:MAG: hypothetical protein GY847_24675 [Proteobacteria bacterium]|nr:hypothetical protein [Pseudomonadota bacterium]
MDLVPAEERNSRDKVPQFTVRKCRAGGRHQVGWCFMMCKPVDGLGLCGRIAPHGIKGRVLEAMERYEEIRRQESY